MLRASLLLVCLLCSGSSGAEEPTAKELFGGVATPATGCHPTAIGSYAKGCLAGGEALPSDGPAWQAMRLSRNRSWGHPELIAFIERLAVAARADGWPGLLVGDMAQPRGGPMRTGHASHQIGLDVDIWLTPMPDRPLTAADRETLAAPRCWPRARAPPIRSGFTDAQMALIRRAALDPEVDAYLRSPGDQAGAVRSRPGRPELAGQGPALVGPRYAFPCPPGLPARRAVLPRPRATAAGDGCGADLAWWLTRRALEAEAAGAHAQAARAGGPARGMRRRAQSTWNRYSRMMTGIGMPTNHSRIGRTVVLPVC